MKIVQALRGLQETCGISLFVKEITRRHLDAGNECFYVGKFAPFCPVDSRLKCFRTEGGLDCIGDKPDIVHIHSVWSMFSVRVMWWCRRNHVKYVVSPHGCLMPWVMKKGWLKKRLFFELFLRRNMDRAAFVHATTDFERKALRELGINSKIKVFPLGVTLPLLEEHSLKDSKRTILFLSRLSPEKGLVNLLEAWQRIPHDGWRLVLAGPDWFGHQKVLEEMIAREGITGVEFPGKVFGEKKSALYRSATFFVLPSFTENFSAVIADALAYGVPVITTKGTPWQVLEGTGQGEERRCGWWVDIGVAPLVAVLKDAMFLAHDVYEKMSRNARNLVEHGYCWDTIARELQADYVAAIKTRA